MKQILLLGGGHAHTTVVRTLAETLAGKAKLRMVAAHSDLLYSGMMPGLIAGHYRLEQCGIALDALCERHGVDFREDTAVAIDTSNRRVRLASGASCAYDLLSLNLGSVPAMPGVRGEVERVLPVKPFERFLRGWDAVLRNPPARAWALVVVGGGAAGVEVALAIRHALRSPQSRAVPPAHITLVDTSPQVLSTANGGVRRRVMRRLAADGIAIRTGAKVVRIGPETLELADGGSLAADHVIWATGAAPQPWLAQSGLAVDTRGFVAVDDHLQSLSHRDVFAAGDTATQVAHPYPKAGVYAVRHGPVIAANLLRTLHGEPLQTYAPQRRFLALLSAGSRHAIGHWGPLAFEGAWVWRWKDHIDRNFILQHQAVSGAPTSARHNARHAG